MVGTALRAVFLGSDAELFLVRVVWHASGDGAPRHSARLGDATTVDGDAPIRDPRVMCQDPRKMTFAWTVDRSPVLAASVPTEA